MATDINGNSFTANNTEDIIIQVVDALGSKMPIRNACIQLKKKSSVQRGAKVAPENFTKTTDDSGVVAFKNLESGSYSVEFLHPSGAVTLECLDDTLFLKCSLGCTVENKIKVASDCSEITCRGAQVGDVIESTPRIEYSNNGIKVVAPLEAVEIDGGGGVYFTSIAAPGSLSQVWKFIIPPKLDSGFQGKAEIWIQRKTIVSAVMPTQIAGQVTLNRAASEPTKDIPLWVAIRAGTEALSFNTYLAYMNLLFEGSGKGDYRNLAKRRALPFNDTDGYRVLKAATEAFVMVNCAVLPADSVDLHDENVYLVQRGVPPISDLQAAWANYSVPEGSVSKMLPYLALIRSKLPDVPIISQCDGLKPGETSLCVGILQEKLAFPCLIELIWSYWMEEAGLVQTMNAVTRRFQNRRAPGAVDPLANLEIDPLRPLSNLLWGYTQDEQHRLTVNRRNHEYDHQYGLHLQGRAVQDFRPADSRSQFLEAFHQLLRLCMVFYKQDDDTTVKADAFPVLNALKEVHLVLSQAAHNQFGDMPATARCEMLMQQWLLGRPEFREFLPSRVMVAYPEPWMDRVDAMKKLQGWTDTSVVHFRNLAKFGEQLLLSARYGHWSDVQEPAQAFNWARVFRPQIQGYAHAYRAATGVDLTDTGSNAATFSMLPSLLMQRRMAQQARSA